MSRDGVSTSIKNDQHKNFKIEIRINLHKNLKNRINLVKTKTITHNICTPKIKE